MHNSPPILLILFNRPDATRVLIDALRKIKPGLIYIAQDGPRHADDQVRISMVRKELDTIDWGCVKKELFQEKNLGCYQAVTTGIDWFFSENEFGIILEDDCIPSASFFQFCLEAHRDFSDTPDIGLISGSNFLKHSNENKPFLSKHTPLLWGWATWRDRWMYFSSVRTTKDMLIRKLENQLIGYSYWDRQSILHYVHGDYWDADWYLVCLSNNWKTLLPPQNQITNIGTLGIHSGRPGPYHFLPRFEGNSSSLSGVRLKINPCYDNEMLCFMRRMFLYTKVENILQKLGLASVIKKIVQIFTNLLYKHKN